MVSSVLSRHVIYVRFSHGYEIIVTRFIGSRTFMTQIRIKAFLFSVIDARLRLAVVVSIGTYPLEQVLFSTDVRAPLRVAIANSAGPSIRVGEVHLRIEYRGDIRSADDFLDDPLAGAVRDAYA